MGGGEQGGYQDDVIVSYVSQPGVHKDLCGVEKEGLRDVAAEGVPVVPAHRGRAGKAVVNGMNAGRKDEEEEGGGTAHFGILGVMEEEGG